MVSRIEYHNVDDIIFHEYCFCPMSHRGHQSKGSQEECSFLTKEESHAHPQGKQSAHGCTMTENTRSRGCRERRAVLLLSPSSVLPTFQENEITYRWRKENIAILSRRNLRYYASVSHAGFDGGSEDGRVIFVRNRNLQSRHESRVKNAEDGTYLILGGYQP